MDPGSVRRIIRPIGPWAPVQSLRSESGGVGMSTTTLHPASRSRWMDWTPKARILADTAESEPTKTSETDSVVSVGATSAESPEIGAEPDPAESARASAVLNRAGVRIMALEGGATIGVWSDLDGPEIRAALRTFGSDRLPVRYLDGAGIPMQYKARHVEGEPVPVNVLAEMERHPAEPWKVRDRMLKEMGWCSVRHGDRKTGKTKR